MWSQAETAVAIIPYRGGKTALTWLDVTFEKLLVKCP
jgi:hypothetical protein